jgi:hypothetical protein
LQLLPPEQPNPNANRVLVTVWQQNTPEEHTLPNALAYDEVVVNNWPVTYSLPLEEDCYGSTMYHFVLQVAEYDAVQDVLGPPGPPAVWSFSLDSTSLTTIGQTHGTVGDGVDIDRIGDLCTLPRGGNGADKRRPFNGGDDGGGEVGAASVPLPCLPCFPDGLVPSVPLPPPPP